MTSKVWDVMNDLEMVTSKIVSAREIIDAAVDRLQEHQYDKAETMITAAYEFLEYYLNEFDEKFKLAWQETVVKQKEEENDAYDAAIKEREYYEPSMPPWGHSDLEYSIHYTDEEITAMCDKAEEEDKYKPKNGVNYNQYVKAKIEAGSAWNDGWTREYYQKIVDKYEGKEEEKKLNYNEAIAAGWTMTDDGFWIKENKKKWVLPVEEAKDADTDKTDYFVSFPDDLLEAANLKEGDEIEWVDNNDGTCILRKITKPLGMDEC